MSAPSYLETFNSGKLQQITGEAFKMLESCSICPRKCKVNRKEGKVGFCKTALKAKVCSSLSHHGEEPPVSGNNGSGTIFFSHCNMACAYCQNYEFSQLGQGREVSDEELADLMLQLQKEGCHNINFVTPTHVMPQILKSLLIAIPQGLHIPLVYNTGGYELPEIIKLLDGIVDIYLVDMRYGDNSMAIQYSSAPRYPEYNQASLKEMHRQTGVAVIDKKGIIKRGVIIRHLVLPNGISGTRSIMKFISEELSPETYISLMSQYLPYYKAREFPDISRRLKEKEYTQAQDIMHNFGLHNGWIQESYGEERFAGVNIKPSLLRDGA
ncbi:MAG: radical SAM protein [Candidatus Omnitrophota bacterium]|jgi:putative pyruvate formate lyase activating enzyme